MRAYAQGQAIRDRLHELYGESVKLAADPPRDALARERNLQMRRERLRLQLDQLNDRAEMLIAYDWQRRHGFPLLPLNVRPPALWVDLIHDAAWEGE